MKALEPDWMDENDALDAIRITRHVSDLPILEAYLLTAKLAGVPAENGCVRRTEFLSWLRPPPRKGGRPPGSKVSPERDLFTAVLAVAIRRVDPLLTETEAIRGAIRQSTPGLPKNDGGGLSPNTMPNSHEQRIRRTLRDRAGEIEELLKGVPANAPGQVRFRPGSLSDNN